MKIGGEGTFPTVDAKKTMDSAICLTVWNMFCARLNRFILIGTCVARAPLLVSQKRHARTDDVPTNQGNTPFIIRY
jgi:hypothetical protein